jgi:putative transposase
VPRGPRLDLPGLLQHVMVRGIEGRDIFRDDRDRDAFASRLSAFLEETHADLLAWACSRIISTF